MLHYSKSAGYAIHALSHIGAATEAVLVRDIASRTRLQKPYLAKIINQLARRGLITAKRGLHGGVVLAKDPEKISLYHIIDAVERDGGGTVCFFGLEKCPCNYQCPMHERWLKMQENLRDMLRQTSLSEVISRDASPPESQTHRARSA